MFKKVEVNNPVTTPQRVVINTYMNKLFGQRFILVIKWKIQHPVPFQIRGWSKIRGEGGGEREADVSLRVAGLVFHDP